MGRIDRIRSLCPALSANRAPLPPVSMIKAGNLLTGFGLACDNGSGGDVMLDIRLFRDQPEFLKSSLGKMGVPPEEIDRVRALDERVRALKTEAETRKGAMNAASKAL